MGAGQDVTVVHPDVGVGADASNCDASVSRLGSEMRRAISKRFRLLAWDLANVGDVGMCVYAYAEGDGGSYIDWVAREVQGGSSWVGRECWRGWKRVS